MPSLQTTQRITSQAAASGEQQLVGFIKKFDWKNATLIRSAQSIEQASAHCDN
jgi:hypothetical protein